MYDPFEIEAPPPGAVFYEEYTHPDNLEILEGDERARKLPPKLLKQIRKKIQHCQQKLEECGYDGKVALFNRLKESFYDSKAELVGCDDPERIREINLHMRRCQHKAQKIRAELETHKHYAVYRHRAQMRIQEHEIALRNAKLYAQLNAEMEREVVYFQQQIIRRWSALGYREEIHKDGKTTLIPPMMEEAHVTEDEIQFKIRASRITLWGSTQQFLPYQVKVQDLVKPETLAELSAVCERPVTSPHNPQEFGGQDKDFSNGAWVVVHRIGMNGGLFNYIELSSVLKKYNQANRHRYPVPFGVRRGRKINYCNLDEHPHVFVDGQTFAGKTNAIVQGLCTLIQMHSPDELRIMLADLKRGGDFNPFDNIPHLITFEEEGSIIKSPEALQSVLERLVALMYKRMEIISQLTVDIVKYNQRVQPDQRLPRIVMVIDEYSATRMNKAAKSRIDNYCVILSTQARAAGIHLFIGNQQPYANIVPNEVKGNITFKLAGRQMTTGASISAIGSGRATRIDKIPGRMLCNNGHEEFDVQIPYATEKDIHHAVAAARNYPEPDHDVWMLEDTQEIMTFRPPFNEKLLIQTALDEFDGALKARRLWDMYKDEYKEASRPKVSELVANICSKDEIEHDGKVYETIRQPGNFYALVLRDDKFPSEDHINDLETSLGTEVGAQIQEEVVAT